MRITLFFIYFLLIFRSFDVAKRGAENVAILQGQSLSWQVGITRSLLSFLLISKTSYWAPDSLSVMVTLLATPQVLGSEVARAARPCEVGLRPTLAQAELATSFASWH